MTAHVTVRYRIASRRSDQTDSRWGFANELSFRDHERATAHLADLQRNVTGPWEYLIFKETTTVEIEAQR